MSVREWKGQVVFRHEVIPGVAGRSWGVHVARLAGVPEPVVRRAGRLLASLEQARAAAAPPLPLFAAADDPAPAPSATFLPPALVEAMAVLDPDRLSPREALDALYRLRTIFAALHDDAVTQDPDALD